MQHLLFCLFVSVIFFSCMSVAESQDKTATKDLQYLSNKYPALFDQNGLMLLSNDFSGAFEGCRYQAILEPASWEDAQLIAKQMGGELACFETPEKMNYMQSLRLIHNAQFPLWIGLTDKEQEGSWRWTCGENEAPKNLFLLERGQDLEERDYAHLMGRLGFLSRENEGGLPNVSKNFRGMDSVQGFIVQMKAAASPAPQKYLHLAEQFRNENNILYKKIEVLGSEISEWTGKTEDLLNVKDGLDDLLEKHKDFAPLYYQLGNVHSRLSMINSHHYHREGLSSAENYVLQAIKLAPDYGDAYLLLAKILINDYRFDEAQAVLINASTKLLEPSTLHYMWGYWAQRKGMTKIAQVHYEAALDIARQGSHDASAIVHGLALVHKKKRDFEQARKFYIQAVELSPEHPWPRGNYGIFLFTSVYELDESIKVLREALALMDYGMARTYLSYALYAKWAELDIAQADDSNIQAYFPTVSG